MADETATLKDATTVTPPPAEAVDTTKEATPPAATAPVAADADAAEIGRILLESGVTKENINDFLQSKPQLEVIQHMVRTNQKEFLNVLERNDPETWKRFMDTAADVYVERFGTKTPPGKTPDANSELMSEVAALREKTTRLETEQQRRDQAAALAQVENRYNARVDDMFGQLKDVELTKTDKRALKALLDSEIARDPGAVKRVSNGNFVDVAPKFKGILDSYVADKKADADAAKTKREQSSRSASAEFPAGPNPFMVDLPKGFDDSWEGTEDALARALESTAR